MSPVKRSSHFLPKKQKKMSSASDIIRPIVGLATNQFIPMTDIHFIFACLNLSLQSVTLLFWAVLLVALVRDRHYDDPNNLLIVSFALADIVSTSNSLYAVISFVLDRGYARGFIGRSIDYQETYIIPIPLICIGCVWESYILTIGFCASGMSVVVIALDRYLLICHGFFTSWSKTGILLLISWFIALVVPAVLIFPTLPNSVILANGIICYPDFTSKDPIIGGLLKMGISFLCLAVVIVGFCYGNVFLQYQSLLRRKEGGGEMSHKENTALSPKSKLLLKKLVLITANFIATFTPFVITSFFMMANNAEIDESAELVVITIFEIGLLVNPILIYLLDAKMKRSVNEMLGINNLLRKKKPLPIKQPVLEMKTPVLKANVLQLNSPMSPSSTQQSPNDVKTVLVTRN